MTSSKRKTKPLSYPAVSTLGPAIQGNLSFKILHLESKGILSMRVYNNNQQMLSCLMFKKVLVLNIPGILALLMRMIFLTTKETLTIKKLTRFHSSIK